MNMFKETIEEFGGHLVSKRNPLRPSILTPARRSLPSSTFAPRRVVFLQSTSPREPQSPHVDVAHSILPALPWILQPAALLFCNHLQAADGLSIALTQPMRASSMSTLCVRRATATMAQANPTCAESPLVGIEKRSFDELQIFERSS